MLKGIKSTFILDYELYKLDMYGFLPAFKTKYLKTVIERMHEQGLLDVEMVSEYKNLPTLTVTQKGQDFLASKVSTDIVFITDLSDKDVILFDGEEQILYEELQQLR